MAGVIRIQFLYSPTLLHDNSGTGVPALFLGQGHGKLTVLTGISNKKKDFSRNAQ
jgi:hypothetical protein